MSETLESHGTEPQPTEKTFKLGIIIPHYQSHQKHLKQLERCLAAIKKYEPDLLPHTYVMDDFSPMQDGLDRLEKEYGCVMIYLPEKTSYARKVNQGAWQLSKRSYTHMCTLNNDVEITTPMQETLKDVFRAHFRLKVVGGLLLYPTGKIQSAGFRILKEPQFMIDEYDKNSYVYAQAGIYLNGRCVEGVTGALQVIELDFMMRAGAYNPYYPLSFEDVEFCLKTWLKGGWVFYTPAIQGVHCESATRGRVASSDELASLGMIHDACQKIDFSVIHERIKDANSTLGIKL